MKQAKKLEITYRPIDKLKPHAGNVRTHSQAQINQIAKSIQHFDFANPILIDKNGRIIAGHGRVLAARLLGISELPTVCLAEMSEADIRAYVIADNRLAEKAGWDRELLGLELQYLSDLEIDFDLTLTGFELPEVDILLDELKLQDKKEGEPDPADQAPSPNHDVVITQPGDIWNIGNHRLICGDAIQVETHQRLLTDRRARMVFSDPPYNVPISGHVCGLGAIQHQEFAMASGEMSKKEFTFFLTKAFQHLAAFSVDGSIHFQCMDWRHIGEMLAAGDKAYSEMKNLCVWAKNNGGMGSLYRSQHELVFVFKSGKLPHINNVELGKHGRYRTNVWNYAGVNSFGEHRDDLNLHPTVKPVAMVVDAIYDCSNRGDIVLDAFAGSGTTLVAAEKAGRCCYGIEIDPIYCDVTLRRMKEQFDMDAVLQGTGKSFSEMESESISSGNEQ